MTYTRSNNEDSAHVRQNCMQDPLRPKAAPPALHAVPPSILLTLRGTVGSGSYLEQGQASKLISAKVLTSWKPFTQIISLPASNQLAGLSVGEEPASSQLVHSGADRFPVSPSLPEVSNSGGRGNQTRPQVSKKSQPHSTIRRPAQNEQQPRDALRTSSAVRKPASQEAQDAFLCPEACRSLHGVVKTTSASST